MIEKLFNSRFLITRRFIQFGILFLFWASNFFSWKILEGNLSTARVFDSFFLADPFAVIQLALTGATITMDVLIGALIILVLYGLLVGRSFCSWVCPVNIISDSASWTREKLNLMSTARFTKIPANTRYFILALALIITIITGIAAFEAISPIALLTRGIIFGSGSLIFIILILFFLELYVQKNLFCGHLCPLGAFYSSISRWRFLKVRLNNDLCTKCMLCKKVCPEVQVLDIVGLKSGNISSGECTNCGRCIEVCEDKALKFTLKI